MTRRCLVIELFVLALLAVDMLQSRSLVAAGQELNPFVVLYGPYVYFAMVGLLHVGIAVRLRQGFWLAMWQGIWLGAQAATVLGNIVR